MRCGADAMTPNRVFEQCKRAGLTKWSGSSRGHRKNCNVAARIATAMSQLETTLMMTGVRQSTMNPAGRTRQKRRRATCADIESRARERKLGTGPRVRALSERALAAQRSVLVQMNRRSGGGQLTQTPQENASSIRGEDRSAATTAVGYGRMTTSAAMRGAAKGKF